MSDQQPLFSIDTHGQFDPHIDQEWLLTNGLGGYAEGTVLGCNTRRYHGLLCAATMPPVGRMMLLNRVAEVVRFDGHLEPMHWLAVNQFKEVFFPRGDQYLRHFHLGDTARWECDVEGATITKELQLLWLSNTIGVRYTIKPPRGRTVQFQIRPFVSLRDFHSLLHQETSFDVKIDRREVTVRRDATSLFMRVDAGDISPAGEWWHDHTYRLETRRGLDDREDLYCAANILFSASKPATITLWASDAQMGELNWDEQLERRRRAVLAFRQSPENSKANRLPPADAVPQAPAITRLLRAANDFVVQRKTPDGREGSTILAGYPWFADWGRDTMIALPGLLLTTGRLEQARQVLSVFAEYVSEGMIPNRFDDYTNEPQYNTVDASLWFIHAVFEYLKASDDTRTFDSILQPACRAIIEGYRHGTRFGIKMDEADGLITQGDAQTQLTWMDAKTNGVAFTPRQGKAVEINALWYHALRLMGDKPLGDLVEKHFRNAFWISPYRGLADVITDGRRDLSLRPNQIFAVSLPNSPLKLDEQRAVVEVVKRELLTPFGLRTLSREDPRYHPHYGGSPAKRDEAYHNGTIWPWPLGAFLDAYLRVNDRSEASITQAKQWLAPLIEQMGVSSIGQLHEIYEAESPHRPDGCPAQAWSVAEVLRLAVELRM